MTPARNPAWPKNPKNPEENARPVLKWRPSVRGGDIVFVFTGGRYLMEYFTYTAEKIGKIGNEKGDLELGSAYLHPVDPIILCQGEDILSFAPT